VLDNVLSLERQAIDEAVEGLTLVDVLARNARSHPTTVAIAWRVQGTEHQLTWDEYRLRVMAATAALVERGVEPGDVVAIMIGNRSEHVIADLAAIHAGAIPVSVYSTLAPNQIAYIANHCSAKVAILESEAVAAEWQELDIPSLETYVVLRRSPDSEARREVVAWEDFEESGRLAFASDSAGIERRAAEVTAEDVATLIYTSGTTGTPKGVSMSHYNLLWTAESMSMAIDLPESPRLVSYLPLAHIAERAATHYLGMWLIGQVTYCANVAAIMNVLKDVRPHLFVGVPRIWEKVADRLRGRLRAIDDPRRKRLVETAMAEAAKVDGEAMGFKGQALDRLVLSKIREELGFGDLRMAITTAGPIDPDLIRFFRSVGVPLYELYGMTECCGPATTNIPGYDKIGSVGRAFTGVEVRIDDVGELFLRGGNVASGYYRDSEATALAFSADGWLRTGDLAQVDENGFVTIVGRSKELIVTSSGKNIAPVHLEQLLSREPLIGQVCVMGDKRAYLTAVIAIDRDALTRDMAALGDPASHPEVEERVALAVAAANGEVAKVEHIKKYVVVNDEWTPETGELTPSFKLKRRVVHEKYADAIADLYI